MNKKNIFKNLNIAHTAWYMRDSTAWIPIDEHEQLAEASPVGPDRQIVFHAL